MLIFQTLLNGFVELLVGTRCLRRVEVTSANDVRISCVEVERVGDVFKVAER